MRHFYLMRGDSDESLFYVADYVDHEFDDEAVVATGVFNGPFPAEFEIYVSDGKPADIIANVIGYQLISERFYKAVQPLVESHTQVLIPPLVYASDHSRGVEGFVLLQLCHSFECANIDDDPSFRNAVFDSNSIPNDIHAFRRSDSDTQAYVSEEFVEAVSAIGPIGLEFHRLNSLGK